LVDISHEGTLPPLDVRLDYSIEISLVANVLDLLSTSSIRGKSQVWLQLESTRLLVVHDDLAHTHHRLIHLSVVIEELLGSVVVANALVHVQLVQECIKSWECMRTNSFSGNVHRKPVFALSILMELKVDELRITFADGCKDDIGSPDVSLAERLLLIIVKEKSFNTLVNHL